jgi:hypothetical protein
VRTDDKGSSRLEDNAWSLVVDPHHLIKKQLPCRLPNRLMG